MNTLESKIINGTLIGVVKTNGMFFIFREVRPVFGLLDGKYSFRFEPRISPKFGQCWRLDYYRDEAGTIYEHLPRSSKDLIRNAQILIHKGNKPIDSAGCWLPGLTLHETLTSIEVRRSTEAFRELMISSEGGAIEFELICRYKSLNE